MTPDIQHKLAALQASVGEVAVDNKYRRDWTNADCAWAAETIREAAAEIERLRQQERGAVARPPQVSD